MFEIFSHFDQIYKNFIPVSDRDIILHVGQIASADWRHTYHCILIENRETDSNR